MQNSPSPSRPALRAGSGLKIGLLLACAAWCLLAPARGGLTHRYPFDADGSDVVGGADAIFEGSAFIENGGVVLSGFDDTYVELPGGLISGYQALTIEAWAEFGDNGNWCRLYDIGDQNPDTQVGRYYVMMTPHSSFGDARMSIAGADPGYSNEYIAAAPGVLDNQGMVHIAAVYDPPHQRMELFINGERAALTENVPLGLDTVQDVVGYLGKSLYAADAPLNGTIYEFRIYDEALSPLQIAASYAAGPDNPNTDPGPLQSISLQINPPTALLGSFLDLRVLGSYANADNINITDMEGVQLSSSDTNVLAFVDGSLKALGLGTATVTAAYQGFEAAQAVTVISIPAQLRHRWSFNESVSDYVAADSVGGADGELWNDAYFTGDGKVSLEGIEGYVDLPNGIVSALTNATFEAWVTWHDDGVWWQRVFDFGNSDAGEDAQGTGTTYLFLTPRGGNNRARFGITSQGPGAPERITDASTVLPAEEPVYIAVVYNYAAREARLYLNGRLAGTGPADVPLQDIEDVNNWLGRSQFQADAYFRGEIDEFRMYEGALTDAEIAIHAAAGPDQLLSDIGELQTVSVQAPASMLLGQRTNIAVKADFSGLASVDVSTLPATIITVSDPTVLAVTPDGFLDAVGVGTAVITANFQGKSGSATVAVQPPQGVPYPPELAHRWSFNEAAGAFTAADSVGGADGVLFGSAQFTGDGKLILDGTDGCYVDLPNGIISVLTNATFEAWVTWRGPAGSWWQRIFDFGNSSAGEDGQGTGTTYLFLTPRGGASTVRFGVTAEGPGALEQITDGPSLFPVDEPTQAIVSYDYTASLCRLYINGERVAAAPLSIPLSSIQDVNNWLGRSQFFDPYFNGEYDEFRIWNGAMTDADAAAAYAAGPDRLPGEGGPPPTLQAALEGSMVRLSWPASAAGYELVSSGSVGPEAEWTPVAAAPEQEGDQLAVRIAPTDTARFYRLRKND